MDLFSVQQLSTIAGISIRTLHHYDQIGLLKPVHRSESNYRYYGRDELLRLQQILLYKEMEFSLAQIKDILDDPGFDLLQALEDHRRRLMLKKERIQHLLQTIEHTIQQLKHAQKPMDYKDLYKGLSDEQALAYQKEAAERWGKNTMSESGKRVLSMSAAEWEQLQRWGEEINQALVCCMHLPVSDERVQALVQQHYEMTGKYFDVTPDIYRAIGRMYTDDERFRAFYEKYQTGLAAFLTEAIEYFCTLR